MDVIINDTWDEYLSYFESTQRDIYFTEEYVSLYADDKQVCKCSIVSESGNYMLFPFLSREFVFHGVTYNDFETAYGYGGPIFNTNDIVFQEKAIDFMYEKLKSMNYVAGFIRFHPLLDNQKSFRIGTIIPDRKTIAIDLSLSEEDIWKQEIHSKNRNVIKKAIKNSLIFKVDDKFEYLDEFIRLYDLTMDKLDASDFYYFDRKYYDKLVKQLPNSFLGLVFCEDKVISSAIFMYDGPYAHYHLSGSDVNYLQYSPNNFMLYQAALELKKRGAMMFHLGGGTISSDEDSLFCFKSRFSKHNYQFYIGKLIFNEKVYNQVCREWEQANPNKIDEYKHILLKYKY